jgi:protein SCO1/2
MYFCRGITTRKGDLSEASFPSYGDEMPDFPVPDLIHGEETSAAQFEGKRAVL